MKILVFNGSPKGDRSNTLKLTNAFLEGIVENKAADVDVVEINKLNIDQCRGCFSCWNKTPGKCVMDDDMTTILQKLVLADVIIWSFPLYYYSLPSRLKMVIDRQLPLCLPFMKGEADAGGHPARYDMDGKRYVVISTCGFYTAEGNYDAVNAQFDRIYGKGNYTALYCGQGELFRVPELSVRTDAYLENVKTAGAEFARGGITDHAKERLKQLLYPREAFEQMADASWGIEKDEQSIRSVDPALAFTKQMAALYNRSSWQDRDVVLELCYTDMRKTYQIVLGKDGHTVLTENFLPYTTKIETPLSVWKKIGRGELNGQQAMFDRLYKVTGDFEVMLRWDEYFGWSDGGSKDKAVASVKKTNMTVMLLPWITIWTLLSISSFWGGLVGIVMCSALPFAFLKYKATIFTYISLFAVTIMSLLSILGYPTDILIPASYFTFGVMWMTTVFLRTPLSAWYSMNHYGGEKALKNPLFVQTNRILTACWGALYLLTPIWTYVLLQTSISPLTGIVNSVLPILLGVFTAWFQKWYPKHYAARCEI